MRLASWNCQTGLGSNWTALERLEADVVTIQECGSEIEAQAAQRRNWTCAWRAGRWHKALAVLARAPYAVQEREPSQPFAVSTLISGPVSFRFVGFWAMTEKDVGLTYTRQATRVIEGLPEDGVPTVLAGDFNASKSPAHLRNVERLASRGLMSAYHAHHGVEHWSTEEYPTSYHMWQQNRPFHMDFVFVPRGWRIDAVDVGLFEDYSFRGGSSDHVPVVVTIGGFG